LRFDTTADHVEEVLTRIRSAMLQEARCLRISPVTDTVPPFPGGASMNLRFEKGDALLVVDLQRDFLPGGALGVPDGHAVVPVMNRYIEMAVQKDIPVFASRDWHPRNHCSFVARGGIWPPHCVAKSEGAEFAEGLKLLPDAVIVSKAMGADADAYSAFQGTELHSLLRARGIRRLWVGGLATDYCVLATVLDARNAGYDVLFLEDASRAVEVQAGDGARAVARMREAGAVPVGLPELAA
jgi:nicotinamidase/pyrazinamidase